MNKQNKKQYLTPDKLRLNGRLASDGDEGGELRSNLRFAALPGVDCIVMSNSITASSASKCRKTWLN